MNSGTNSTSDLSGTLSDWTKGLKLMMHPRSWAFFIYPIALSFFLGMGIFGSMLWWLVELVKPFFSVQWPSYLADAPLTEMVHWIIDQFGEAAISLALFVAVLLLALNVFKWLQLILLAPYMSYLSAKLADELTGTTAPFQWNLWWKDALRSMFIATLNFGLQIGFVLGVCVLQLLVAAWLPVLLVITVPLTAVLNMAFSAYFTGAALMDLPLESQHFTWRERWQKVHQSKVAAVLHGALFSLLLSIPLVGIWLASAVGASAVTYTAHRKHWISAQTTR